MRHARHGCLEAVRSCADLGAKLDATDAYVRCASRCVPRWAFGLLRLDFRTYYARPPHTHTPNPRPVVDCQPSQYWTPLHYASAGGHAGVVAELLARGVD